MVQRPQWAENDEAAPVISVTQSKGATPSANPAPGQETTEPAPRKVAINPTVNNDDTATDPTEESDDSDSSNNNSTSSSTGECDTPGAGGKTYQIVVEKAILTAPMLKKSPPQGDGGRDGERSSNFQFWDSATDDWSCVSPTYATAKRETAPLAVAMKNWDPHSLFLLTLGKTATNYPQEPSTIENKGRAKNRR